MLPNVVFVFIYITIIQNVLTSDISEPNIEGPIKFHGKVLNKIKNAVPHDMKGAQEESSCIRRSIRPIDCSELLLLGYNQTAVYKIWPRNKIIDGYVYVLCDMETDGGGWTVVQRRGQFHRGKYFFYKDWRSYKEGFGEPRTDSWLGNDNIFAITNQRPYSIRIDLTRFDGTTEDAIYDDFFTEDELRKYRLHVRDYRGTAGDSFTYQNLMNFSTYDRNNDKADPHCAQIFKGGWWYNKCFSCELNGLYLGPNDPDQSTGIIWGDWSGCDESLCQTEMKIRPKHFEIKPVTPVPCKGGNCQKVVT